MADLLVYGSYGYTGALVAREAVDRGLDVVVAGRDRTAVENQAVRLDCEERVVGLDEPRVLDLAMEAAPVVLNCAGPFVDTYEPVVEACLRTGTHYLDVTGEVAVFEALAAVDDRAREAGVTLLPGVGFDVVPTDCLAAHLAERVEDPTQLALGFEAAGGMSPGTAKTTVRGLGDAGAVRRDGRIEHVPAGAVTRRIDFGNGERPGMAIPWGDVSTAYHTTGIPNVTVYTAASPWVVRAVRAAGLLGPVLSAGPVRSALETLVERRVDGPDERARETGVSYVWGEVVDADGRRAVSRLRGPETYRLTKLAALAVAERVLDSNPPAGFRTPAGACGPDLVLDVEGVERADEPVDARAASD
ncbi:MAG: saccharopine dehydrogenase NADP-binding domain-containing protein [Haloarculaceae archaeon]